MNEDLKKQIKLLVDQNHCRYCDGMSVTGRCEDDREFLAEELSGLIETAITKAKAEERERIKNWAYNHDDHIEDEVWDSLMELLTQDK